MGIVAGSAMVFEAFMTTNMQGAGRVGNCITSQDVILDGNRRMPHSIPITRLMHQSLPHSPTFHLLFGGPRAVSYHNVWSASRKGV